MSLNLVNYEAKAIEAVKAFWGNRDAARQRQIESGRIDQGERGSVTDGKNMDGFIDLIIEIVHANGLGHAQIHLNRGALTLPGYFRPTKLWDLLITYEGQLIAAIELKSQVGPSFGNNFNNRTEEAIGTAHDFWTAYRDGAFGMQPAPFMGWLMLVEEAAESMCPVNNAAPHFSVFPEFVGASYLRRYDILCQRLVREKLYNSAALLTSPRGASLTGEFSHMSELTSLRTFISSFAGHIGAEAARLSRF
jgi:type II restriction enzyme